MAKRYGFKIQIYATGGMYGIYQLCEMLTCNVKRYK